MTALPEIPAMNTRKDCLSMYLRRAIFGCAAVACAAWTSVAFAAEAGSPPAGQAWPPSPDDKVVRISGIYPHLSVFNGSGECGIGALMPWADKLWFLTYPPHRPQGSEDKLYTVDKNLKLEIRPESVGGTHANRLIHRESNQLIIGPYLIDAGGNVRALDLKQLVGRMTSTARHLADPANKVYFYDMEGVLYEVDVHTLAVTRLFEKPVPGWHGKGGYSGQGRLVLTNNGEIDPNGQDAFYGKKTEGKEYLAGAAPADPSEKGVLAQWDGHDWKVVERHQFTEVTSPGGVAGASDASSPLWAMGWDKCSVLLKLLDGGEWSTFRLPKASFTQEDRGGFYTEWPRIREVTDGRLLAHMQGLFYDFPKTFSKANTAGLKPISTYTRMPVDYCAWQGEIVMARDDASIMQNELAGQSHSNLWFGSWADLENLGAPAGWGGVWLDEDVKAGAVSDPFLVNGFTEGVLHLKQTSDSVLNVVIEADLDGRGKWQRVADVSVPAKGYAYRILDGELKAQWVRLRVEQPATGLCAFFRLGNPARPATPERFQALADIGFQGAVVDGIVKPASNDARKLLFAANRYEAGAGVEKSAWSMDGRLELTPMNDPEQVELLRNKFGAGEKPAFSVDAASVIVADGANGKRYRLPKSAADYDQPFASGWPRARREIVTERNLFNAHGTIYEVPRFSAGNFQHMRPICTHHKRISDFASWRGLLVLAGVRADAAADEHCYKSADGKAAVWFGEVDDLWRMGAPVGTGGPWKDSAVVAGQPSDPYLMGGYRTKSLTLSHQAPEAVKFDIEVDITGDNHWCPYAQLTVEPGKPLTHVFPAGYSAQWVRLRADRDTLATAQFVYEP